MSWHEGVIVTVVGGVLLNGALALFRSIWSRGTVPTALERPVRRGRYLKEILSASERNGVVALDVLAPRLVSAGDGEVPQRGRRWRADVDATHIAQIQVSWKRISGHGRVRVLTLDSDESLKAGAQLLKNGIQVRVVRRELGAERFSYHLFSVRGDRSSSDLVHSAIVNHHEGGVDQPNRFNGQSPVEIFRDHFRRAWESAIPLESVVAEKIIENVIAERILENPDRTAQVKAILRTLNEASAHLGLDTRTAEGVLRHLAFRHGCPVVFVVGLPGAGKSYVRRILEKQLRLSQIRVQGLTNYVYAYRDFLHGLIKLEPPRGIGFEPYPGGAFLVQEEATLRPALQALAQAVRDSVKESEVTLVEFARADLLPALEEFGELRTRSHVVHVQAPAPLRETRLRRRAEPPEPQIHGDSVTLALSDNHLLPSSAERSLYGEDDIDLLKESPKWRDRIFQIENNVDDNGERVNASVQAFINGVVGRYQLRSHVPDDEAPQAAHWV